MLNRIAQAAAVGISQISQNSSWNWTKNLGISQNRSWCRYGNMGSTEQIRLRIPSIAQVERLGIKQNILGTRARRTACLLALVTASASTNMHRTRK